MTHQVSSVPRVVNVGNGWFPTNPGGLNRYIYELSNELVNQHTEVELCAAGIPDSATSKFDLINLSEPDTPFLKRLWMTRHNFRAKSSQPLHGINLHFALYSLPLLSSLPADLPITFTFHGPWALESAIEDSNALGVWMKRWMELQVYRRCDRFIVLSRSFQQILHEKYGIPMEKIHLIPGGVDTQRFQNNLTRQEARTQLNWPQDRQILFTPRRLVHRMGIDRLLQALAQIKPTVPDLWLAIAGKGRLREDLESQSVALGLANDVKFLGFLPDEQLPIAYQAADLSVIPSRALEGFGLILLESLASGTPVMCTPVGGMPEVIESFSPDLITDSTSTDAIASRLASLLTGNMHMPTREACRDYAATHFNWPKITQQVRQVLMAPQ